VDGYPVRTLPASALGEPLDLRLPAGGPGRVTVVAHTTDGRMLGATRDYR
jgi:hypothetical protein